MAAVKWETTVVPAGTSVPVTSTDVVIVLEASSAGTMSTLPAAGLAQDGRILVYKRGPGVNDVLIHSNPSNLATRIDDASSTTFNIGAELGAVVFVYENTANIWYTIAVAGG